MSIQGHMIPVERGCPSWMGRGHYQNVLAAAHCVRERTGLSCWLDQIGRVVFFGRVGPDGLIAGIFNHQLFREGGAEVWFGELDNQVSVDHVCRIAGIANVPWKVKAKWHEQREFMRAAEAKARGEKWANDDDKLRDVLERLRHKLERRSMGRHYRPMVTT